MLREFLVKMTGLSVPQVTRLIGQYLRTGQVREKEYGRHRFARQYRPDDIVLLAAVDTAHGSVHPVGHYDYERSDVEFDRSFSGHEVADSSGHSGRGFGRFVWVVLA